MSRLNPTNIYPLAGLATQSDWRVELMRFLPGRLVNHSECQHVFQRITKFATDAGKITLVPGTFNQDTEVSRHDRGETACTQITLGQELEISPSTEEESLLGLLADMQEIGFGKKFFRVRIRVDMMWEPNFSSVQYLQTGTNGTELSFELRCKMRVSSMDVTTPSYSFDPAASNGLSTTDNIFQVEKEAEIIRGKWQYPKMQDRNQELSFCHAACYNFSSSVLTHLEETIKFVLFLHLKG